MNDIDIGRQKSINDLIERAKEEREKAIDKIDFLLNYKVSTIFSIGEDILSSLEDISESINIEFKNSNNIEELKDSFISTLNSLKQQLQSIEMTEEELLSSTLIGDSYEVLEEISEKLDMVPKKILESSKKDIINEISENEKLDNQKDAITARKIDLEKQEMYLRGMLEVTILGKKKKELEEKILQIRDEIENLDTELINIDSFGNNESDVNKADSEIKSEEDIELE